MKVQAMTETLHDERIYSGVGPLASDVVYGFIESPCWSAECADVIHKKPFKVTN